VWVEDLLLGMANSFISAPYNNPIASSFHGGRRVEEQALSQHFLPLGVIHFQLGQYLAARVVSSGRASFLGLSLHMYQ